jgi:hypothetical protein
MGRKDHRRRLRDLRRRGPTRQPRDSILIVCEGEKTEPNYFDDLRRALALTTVEVEIIGKECGSAPTSVVTAALEARKRRSRAARRGEAVPYDQVWCVIDAEAGRRNDVLYRAAEQARTTHVHVALSNPSFELWYLLHFRDWGKPLRDGSRVIHELRKYLEDYEKGGGHFAALYPKTADAIRRSKTLCTQRWHDETNLRKLCDCNPCTTVHLLVELLHNISAKPRI